MEIHSDTYKTLSKPSEEILFKEKKSKFYGYAFPIQSEEDVKPLLEEIKKRYHTAGHVCYAWQLGIENPSYRANDDGEPNNSAGMPIYGQIQSFEVTNVLVAVARIYGGTKLGVGGLISAYKTGAQMALENAKIIEKIIQVQFALFFEYADMDKVMRIIKQEQLSIVSQKMELDCKIVISVRKDDEEKIHSIFSEMHTIKIKPTS
ncbi:YigZ family protein [Cellulophaga sp. HaHa_2_95]|uniref:IMPACT family protein n=1 Tax=unclassified Cellulophaga TaxID=2634405 RepID=UPI001C501563|nr:MULTISPECIES: YigZ family protein [unclassified Cellulophaga]QXP53465.1 YigZ family protein [Cellulophaga sp. HaHa_2_1]QXP57927.1 YigZ family protein [Cellulophaga sp. HaHa_2_95]